MSNQSQINGILSPLLQKMRLRNAKPFFKGKRFLDIGSSLGEVISYLPKDMDYVGIEGNLTYMKNAQKIHPSKKFINLYLDKDNVKKLDIQGKFDTMIMLAIIEHVDYPGEILKGLSNYLSDDGVIIMTTPNKTGNLVLHLGSKLRLFMNEMHEHRELFTKERLYKIAEEADLVVKHYHTFEFGLNHLIVLSKKT